MGLESVKYNAFISYRHAPLDSFVARNIHKMLETYKVPADVAKKLPEGKRNISRIFRDEEELPLADNLSDPIDEALHNSEFLIVICTPRLKQSKWCLKEISSFISYHGRDHVLCVLAEGEPDDSFPEILTKETSTSFNEAGEEVTTTHEFEPLAAEARGLNEREIKKNLKKSTVRLAAALLGLNYDDLRQRHKERQMKRTIRICTGIASVLLVFSVVCFSLLLKINHQKNTISKQYDEILYENASNVAEISQIALDGGKRNTALEGLLRVMPESTADTTRPYNAKALYTLNDCLGTYRERPYYMAENEYEGESEVNFFTVSPQGSRILLAEAANYILVYNVQDGTQLGRYPVSEIDYLCFEPFFVSEDSIVYASGYDLHLMNVTTGIDDKIAYGVDIFAIAGQNGEFFVFVDGMVTKFSEDKTKEYEIDLNSQLGYWSGMYVYSADYDEVTDELSFAYVNNETDYIIVGDLEGETGILYLLRETYYALDARVCQDAKHVYVYYDAMSFGGTDYNMLVGYDKATGEGMSFVNMQDKHYSSIAMYEKKVSLVGPSSYALVDCMNDEIIDTVVSPEQLLEQFIDSDGSLLFVGASGSIYKYMEGATGFNDYSANVMYHPLNHHILQMSFANNDMYFLPPGLDYVVRFTCEPVDLPKELAESRFLTEEKDPELTLKKETGTASYEIYDSKDKLLGKVEDVHGIVYGIHYYKDIDKYVLNAGYYAYLLDSNFEMIAKMCHVDSFENGVFTVFDGSYTYKVPYVGYDALLEQARNEQ